MIEAVRSRLGTVNGASAPKYQVLRNAILGAIETGEWETGAQLPTESELSRSLPFSLGTVQKAYGELVRSRFVVRSRGRGSFVARGKAQITEPWHCRFLEDDGTVLPVYPTLLGWSRVPDDWPKRSLFGDDPALVRIDRRLSVGGEFEVLSRFFARDSVAAVILDRPDGEVALANFKVVLMREAGLLVSRITEAISTPDPVLYASTGLPAPPHLLLAATAFTGTSEVIYFQELFVPPNGRRLLFDTELHL